LATQVRALAAGQEALQAALRDVVKAGPPSSSPAPLVGTVVHGLPHAAPPTFFSKAGSPVGMPYPSVSPGFTAPFFTGPADHLTRVGGSSPYVPFPAAASPATAYVGSGPLASGDAYGLFPGAGDPASFSAGASRYAEDLRHVGRLAGEFAGRQGNMHEGSFALPPVRSHQPTGGGVWGDPKPPPPPPRHGSAAAGALAQAQPAVFPEDPMHAALIRIADTQALMATVVADRGDGEFGAHESSGGASAGVKGAMLLLRNRNLFYKDPGRAWVRLVERVKSKLNHEEGQTWSVEELAKKWPWGTNKSLKRQAMMWSKVHRALRPESPDLALVRGLVAQAIKVTWQAAYDAGSYDLAWTMFPCEDPVVPGERDAYPPNPGDADPFATLMEAEELAAGMAYLKDVAALAKARAERRQGPSASSGDGGDPSPKKPPKKPKAAPAAQAKGPSA